MGGCGLTLLYDRVDDVIETADDLSGSSNEVFGTIPEWTATTDPAFDAASAPWPGIADPFSAAAESYRHLATNIRLGLPHDVSSIVVTSPGAQEGKTTTAANLAVALTEAGRDVLLLDADLQAPTLHRLFTADRTPGLTDRLAGPDASVQSLHVPTPHSQTGDAPSDDGTDGPRSPTTEQQRGRLGLLAAGNDVPQPALLLQERHLQPLLQSLRSSWDLVLIDTPPALLYDDAFRLASLSDLVLLLATAHQTRRRAIQDVRTRLNDLCPHPVADVLNCDPSASLSGYNYSSSYYPSQRPDAAPMDRVARAVSRGVRRVMKG